MKQRVERYVVLILIFFLYSKLHVAHALVEGSIFCFRVRIIDRQMISPCGHQIATLPSPKACGWMGINNFAACVTSCMRAALANILYCLHEEQNYCFRESPEPNHFHRQAQSSAIGIINDILKKKIRKLYNDAGSLDKK